MKKRISAIFLIIVMIVSLVPVSAVPAAAAEKKLIALTFDDGPGAYTEKLLNALDSRDVKVTFVMLGTGVQGKYKPLVKRAFESGHQIASHTYNHSNLQSLSNDKIKTQINDTARHLNNAIGRQCTYVIRPPYGSFSSRVLSVFDVPGIYWSVDPLDWKYRNVNTVYNNIVSTVKDGDIILLHDIHSTSVDAAIKVVDKLIASGYEFVTVNELFRRKGVTMNPGVMYYSCRQETVKGPVSEPVIKGEALDDGYHVTITADAGAKIYYTTDGSNPLYTDNVYKGDIVLHKDANIRAVAAFDLNGSRSKEVKENIKICAPAPKCTVKNGMFELTGDGPVYYTLDGTVPNLNSALYEKPVSIAPGTEIWARVIKNGVYGEELRCTYMGNDVIVRDVRPSAWYYEAAKAAITQGLIDVTTGNCFAPDVAMTRASIVETLYRMESRPGTAASAGTEFEDVTYGETHYPAIKWASANGIVNGYTDGKFHPNDLVTREQLAAIFYRLAKHDGRDVSAVESLESFADFKSVHEYAVEPLGFMVSTGLLKGTDDNRALPNGTATRAQVATIVMRYKESGK